MTADQIQSAMAEWPTAPVRCRGGRPDGPPLTSGTGWVVLALSAAGYPLTRLAMRRGSVGGALVVEGACGGLFVRDVLMVAGGTPRRLHTGPAGLLWLETAAAAAAAVAGLRPLADAEARVRAAKPHPDRREALRRTAVAVLFALHTVRFWIYLRPGHGLRSSRRSGCPDLDREDV